MEEAQVVMEFSELEDYIAIKDKKLRTSTEEFCAGFPQVFVDFLSYVLSLEPTNGFDYIHYANSFPQIQAYRIKQGFLGVI
jgi:hypothetical protein